ncbi:putative membrane protein, partial [Vibrio cholerae CP1035(8)]
AFFFALSDNRRSRA